MTPEEKEVRLTPVPVGAILAREFGEESWLIENLIPLPGIVALSGNPGQGKTWLTLEFARAVARGQPAFKKFTAQQGAILIIDEEDSVRMLKKRLELLGIQDSDPIHYLSQAGIDIRDKTTIETLKTFCKANNVRLVIIDSFVRVHDADENSSREMSQVLKALQSFTRENISILFTHHHRKQQGEFRSAHPGQEMRGSSDISAGIDSHLLLSGKMSDGLLALIQPKSRDAAELARFEIKVVKDDKGAPRAFEFVGFNEIKPKKTKAEEATEELLQLLTTMSIASRPQLQDALTRKGYGKTVIDFAVLAGVEDGKVEEVPKDQLPDSSNRKQKHYRLPSPSPIKIVPIIPVSTP